MTKVKYLIGVALASILALPSAAHHAFTSLYHMDQQVSIEGVVTRFLFANPHARIYLDVAGDDGEVTSYLAEGGTPNILVRQGWAPDTIKVGDRVRIDGNPAKSDPLLVHWLNITMPDGEVLFGEDLNFDAIDRRRRN